MTRTKAVEILKKGTISRRRQKAIDLCSHINAANPEDIRFEAIRSTGSGARLYRVFDTSNYETGYVIEGETGELKGCWESREEALADWNA
jgi:hypothetical protein